MADDEDNGKPDEPAQTIKLQGEEDYYAREVTVEGVEFCIRELTEDEHLAYLEAAVALRELSGVSGEDLMNLTPDKLIQVAIEIGAKVTPEKAMEVRRASWAMVDGLLVAGVVDWNLAGYECSDENVRRLPNHIKRRLASEILRETQATMEEESFLALSPRP